MPAGREARFETASRPSIAAQRLGSVRRLVTSQITDSLGRRQQDVTSIEVQLDPPELGKVLIQVEKSSRGLTASIVATEDTAFHLLQQDSQTVVQALEELGIDLVGFSLSQHSAGKDDSERREHSQSVDSKQVPPDVLEHTEASTTSQINVLA